MNTSASVQGIFDNLFSFPRPGSPDVIAEIHGGRIKSIRLMLVFRAGESFCCMEPGCHLGFGNKWDELIVRTRALGYIISDRAVIRILGVVQRGAIFRECVQGPMQETYEYAHEHRCGDFAES